MSRNLENWPSLKRINENKQKIRSDLSGWNIEGAFEKTFDILQKNNDKLSQAIDFITPSILTNRAVDKVYDLISTNCTILKKCESLKIGYLYSWLLLDDGVRPSASIAANLKEEIYKNYNEWGLGWDLARIERLSNTSSKHKGYIKSLSPDLYREIYLNSISAKLDIVNTRATLEKCSNSSCIDVGISLALILERRGEFLLAAKELIVVLNKYSKSESIIENEVYIKLLIKAGVLYVQSEKKDEAKKMFFLAFKNIHYLKISSENKAYLYDQIAFIANSYGMNKTASIAYLLSAKGIHKYRGRRDASYQINLVRAAEMLICAKRYYLALLVSQRCLESDKIDYFSTDIMADCLCQWLRSNLALGKIHKATIKLCDFLHQRQIRSYKIGVYHFSILFNTMKYDGLDEIIINHIQSCIIEFANHYSNFVNDDWSLILENYNSSFPVNENIEFNFDFSNLINKSAAIEAKFKNCSPIINNSKKFGFKYYAINIYKSIFKSK